MCHKHFSPEHLHLIFSISLEASLSLQNSVLQTIPHVQTIEQTLKLKRFKFLVRLLNPFIVFGNQLRSSQDCRKIVERKHTGIPLRPKIFIYFYIYKEPQNGASVFVNRMLMNRILFAPNIFN